ncbi:CARDB domain-containing protein [Methanospirillum lacunae]|uniref:CARDB domain-containing protein n=1 Tax=Methanospirillum lacunae TaxID=668570 RepID=UPI0038FC3213
MFILIIGFCLFTNVVCTISYANIIGTRIVIPTTLFAGTPDELQDFIRNEGSESVGPFEIQYFLSSDQNLDGRVIIGEWHIEGLKAGAQKYGNTTFTIPSGTPEGTYYLGRWIDPTGILSAKNPTNNIQWSKVPIQVLNNISSGIEGIGTIVPSTVSVGSNVPVTVIVNLSGKNPKKSGSVNLFLSKLSRTDSSLIPAGGINFPEFSSLGEQEITGNMEIPNDIKTGTYYLFTSFVPISQMNGKGTPSTFWLNEDPLVITSSTEITKKPDIVQNLQDSYPDVLTLDTEQPDEAFIGDSFTVIDSVKNIGGTEANIVRVEYLLSPNTDGTNGKHLGWRTIMSLQPDQTNIEQKLLGVPSDIKAGLNYLVKKITVTSAVQEKNTQNNNWVSNRPINIRYNPASPIPDLTHIRTVWPKAQTGETIPITDTITNIGKGCAKDVSVAYYVSPYQMFDVATAIYLGVWRLDSICPLEQKTNTTYVNIPSDLTNGEYYLYSIIDPCSFVSDCDEGMPELDKSNNINIGILRLGPCVLCN